MQTCKTSILLDRDGQDINWDEFYLTKPENFQRWSPNQYDQDQSFKQDNWLNQNNGDQEFMFIK